MAFKESQSNRLFMVAILYFKHDLLLFTLGTLNFADPERKTKFLARSPFDTGVAGHGRAEDGWRDHHDDDSLELEDTSSGTVREKCLPRKQVLFII